MKFLTWVPFLCFSLVCMVSSSFAGTPLKGQISIMGPVSPENMVFNLNGAGGAIYSKNAAVNDQLFDLAQKNSTICIDFNSDEGDFVVTEILPLTDCG